MSTKYDRLNHNQIIKDYNEIKQMSGVAKKHSISDTLVKKVLINNGVGLIYSKKTLIKDINHNTLIERYKKVYNAITVAKEMGISPTTVLKILHMNGVRVSRIKYSDDQIIDHYKKVGVIKTVCEDLSISDFVIRTILKKNNIRLINHRRIQVGDVFGKLRVTEVFSPNQNFKRKRFQLKCECGNQVVRYSKSLITTKIRDCGCVKLKDRIDKKRLKEEKRIKREKEIEKRRRLREIKLKKKKPRNVVNYIGAVKGRLTIMDIKGKCPNKIFIAKCECGTIKEYKNTIQGKSCGCLQKERSTTHGMISKDKKGYNRWKSMIRRCHNPESKAYHNYGGRGIYVCDRWRLPNGEGCKNYIDDIEKHLGPRPNVNYSIDRTDNDGPYEISNVRWADHSTQTKNQRSRKKNKDQTKINF